MIKSYETTFIVDAHLSNEQIESTISKYSKVITDNSGTIKLIDRWGKRRLAYEIAKKQYGYYVYMRFDAEGTVIHPLEHEYKLDDQIIRYLTVSVPKVVIAAETEVKPTGTDEPETDETKETAEPVKESDEKAAEAETNTDESGDDEATAEADEVAEAEEDDEKSE